MKSFLTPEEIVILITDSYNNHLGIFSNHSNAEDLVPDGSNEEKAQFLFYVLQMDYATKSETIYQNAKNLWINNKRFFDANYLHDLSDVELKEIVSNDLKPRYVNEIVKRYKINSKLLLEKYNGKAINIITISKTATELLKRVSEFRGFGPKLGNFLLRTYVSTFQLDYKDIDEIFQPVDIHDVRQTYEWGFIKTPEMSVRNINDVKNIWSKACKTTGISWIVFDKALWLLGSKSERMENIEEMFYKNLGVSKFNT